MESLPLAGPIADSNSSKKRFNAAPIMVAEAVQAPETPWSSKFQKIDDEEVLIDADIHVDSNEDFHDDDAGTVTKEDKAMKGKGIIGDSDGDFNDISEVVEEKPVVDDQDLYDDNNDDDDNEDDDDIDDDDDGYEDDDYMDYLSEDNSAGYDKLQAQFDNMEDLPPGVEASVPWLADSSKSENSEDDETRSKYSKLPTLKDKNGRGITVIDHENIRVVDIMCRYEHFRRFDTVDDYSDHHYVGSKLNPGNDWAKRIQEDWKILEKDLPETIFVRVYEERMDLMRAVILGAEGTPYHDGLFFFDVFFPDTYPNTPPKVYYQSHGLRLNPNLYANGYVCLSLLNTWEGKAEQKWQPKLSTMLQVLVSIQGLVLNADPYFNEPGYEPSRGTAGGKERSDSYTESTFILSLKTMSYNMRNPPKHFEAFVDGHFLTNAEYILEKCRRYLDGARVGSLVKGGKQEEGSCCSENFKKSLESYLKYLSQDFTNIGIKGIDKFLPASMKKKKQVGSSSLES